MNSMRAPFATRRGSLVPRAAVQNLQYAKADASVGSTCFVYAALMALSQSVQYMLGVEYSAVSAFGLLALFCHVTWIRRSMSDPFSFVFLAGFMYGAFPLLFGVPGTWAALRFRFEGASAIYAVGNVSMALGVGIATLVIGYGSVPRQTPLNRCTQGEIALRAGLCSSLLSCALVAGLIARNGAVVLGQATYSESFRPEARAGNGVLLLAVPFAAGGLVLMLTSNQVKRIFHHIIALSAYAGLYLALGQRKYLIYPSIFYIAKFIRVRNAAKLVGLLGIAGVGMTAFLYLGFLRSEGYGYSQAFQKNSVDRFTAADNESLAGETLPVFATATAAHDGFITALPYGEDYLMSWMMCLPNFLSTHLFVPLNERFSEAYNAKAASEGGGWGFSFFGEAFLVGGYPVVVLATFIMMCVFRWTYVSGGCDLRSGLGGAISLSVLPFTFWFQRNAVAYFVKEFLFLQVGAIVLVYYTVSYIARLRKCGASPSADPSEQRSRRKLPQFKGA